MDSYGLLVASLVGMVLDCELPVGFLNVVGRGILAHTKGLHACHAKQAAFRFLVKGEHITLDSARARIPSCLAKNRPMSQKKSFEELLYIQATHAKEDFHDFSHNGQRLWLKGRGAIDYLQ
jgi:hypothetical protein